MKRRHVTAVVLAASLLLGACSSDTDRSAATTTSALTPQAPTPTTISEQEARTAISAAIAAVEKFELAAVPAGYGPGVAEAMTTYFTITYPSVPQDFGRRLSVQAVPVDQDPSVAPGGLRLGEHAVRDGKPATFFISSDRADNVHARHGLTWIETAKSRVTIYAYNRDPAFFVELAESVRPYAARHDP